MKFKLLVLPVLFFSINAIAQDLDYKWSVEANYPISVGDDLGNDTPGIIDVGLKYRFLDFNIVKIGAGINAGVFKDNIRSFTDPETTNFDETNWLIQPKVFVEFTIPGISKLHPSVGLGYTFIESEYKGFTSFQEIDNSSLEGGINVNLGLSYDIGERFFLQVQYDYVRNKVTFEDFNFENKQNLGFLKAGVGFRF